MHEVSIADALLRQVAEAAARHGLASVTAVGVCVGAQSGVASEALAQAFEVLRRAPAADAALEVRATDGDDLNLEWIEGR